MTLVDSSVWIDLLTDRHTPQTEALNRLIDRDDPVVIGDL